MPEPAKLAQALESRPRLPGGPDWERVRGYGVFGLPFRSGHVLAMRRFPASSIGPSYTSVWHRDPAGRWAIHQDQDPQFACPRAFGPAIDDASVVPISVEWTGPDRFRVAIDGDGLRLRWDVALKQTLVTRALSAFATILPRSVRRHPRTLALTARVAGPLLGAGRLRLAGHVPSGQLFRADLAPIWVIAESTAELDGASLGPLGPLPEQERLGDLWIPQRGLFAFGDGYFELHDPARHQLVPRRPRAAQTAR